MVSGGIPRSFELMDAASAAELPKDAFTFLQISDSHVGFDKPANPNALATLQEAIAKISAMQPRPAFMIHTGDISHLSKPGEFDDADQVIKGARLRVHYVPGEHDLLDDDASAYLERYGKGSKGAGWYSFDEGGIHFVGLVNVVNLKAGGLGNLGREQIEWLERDVSHLPSSTPIVVFAHIPLWTIYPEWGWAPTTRCRPSRT
jgi:3',5'-cyclic AMP phosphodiesterase CpdA